MYKFIRFGILVCYRRSVIVYPQQISSIAVLGSYLYWSDKDQQVIERVDKNTGLLSETVIAKVPLLTDLVAIIQPVRLLLML